jgi:23S rRNA pseudouridine1911/1915/1917 synthase
MREQGDDEVTRDDAAEAEGIRNEVVVERVLTGQHRIVRFSVGRNHGKGWRLDKYLHAICPTLSRNILRRWLDNGCGTLDGKPTHARAKIHPGQRVELSAPLPPPGETLGSTTEPLQIIHEDPLFLVCNKPVGVLAHQAGRVLSGTLLNQVQDYLRERGRDPKDARLVNRIDRDTSGIVLVSLDARAHVTLSAAIEARDVHKEYRAIVHGMPKPAAGSWKDPIAEADDESIAMRIAPDGKFSHTDYDVIATAPKDAAMPRYSLLRVILHTGRQHQIRIHAAHHGHPLVGDWVYGEPCGDLPGQALHAAILGFAHPKSGEKMSISAPFPEPLEQLWERLLGGADLIPSTLNADQRSKLGRNQSSGVRRPAWLTEGEYQDLRKEVE